MSDEKDAKILRSKVQLSAFQSQEACDKRGNRNTFMKLHTSAEPIRKNKHQVMEQCDSLYKGSCEN